MSDKAREILERYLKGYVTEEQLIKYRDLGVISAEEYTIIYETKHPQENEGSEVE